ncbi:hypothetical protein SDC9_108747 [bioreactor metagenome]|uniref:Uncharacterized protein n=1 Tax=bioreactor metagenome TaxID=1076179 RepID=A0A645BJG5_9ZZZZ
MMLPEPARLGTFITENGIVQVVHFGRLRFAEEVVFHEHADDPRRAFRLEGNRTLAFIEEGIHLLLHDIRRFADAAQKQLRMLDDRRTRF